MRLPKLLLLLAAAVLLTAIAAVLGGGNSRLAVALGITEGCLTCHAAVSGLDGPHAPKSIGCASCHAGDRRSTDQAEAHAGMVLIPGNEPSTAEGIRRANGILARGDRVWRWSGANTPQLHHGDLVFSEPGATGGLSGSHGAEPPADGSSHLVGLTPGPVALLWDKSFLWGYLAVRALRDLGFSFDPISAEAVRSGALSCYQLVVVPGGWASLKSEALGPEGRDELRRFVRRGGSYLGLCGGAGLALRVDEGLGLLPVTRKPLTERLPNCSGSIRARRSGNHALWCGLPDEVSFQIWWPSQFEILEPEKVKVVGCYHEPEDDFCVSDLNVLQTQAAGIDWQLLEEASQN